MVEKQGLKSHEGKVELTTAQNEVLHLISDEFLTIKQTAQRRDCSIQAVYKIIKQLKNKGAFDGGLNKVEKIQSTFNQSDIRLHGQEFNIRVLFQDNRYQKELNQSNVLFIDSNTVRLYKNSIEIYSGQSFYGKTTNESEKKGFSYWLHFFARLEHDLSITILKQRARNIKEVNHHYARGDSEIADNSTQNKERIWVYAEEDGKLAFITDDSFGFREDECVHPITAKPDRKAIDRQVNDWRLNNPPTNSEIALNQSEMAQELKILADNMVYAQKELPVVLNNLKEQISNHLKLIQEYRQENINWRKGKIKELKEQLINGVQTSLGEF